MNIDLLQLATPGVRGLQPYVPGKPVEELERELGITHAIKLASNENPLGPSPKALAAMRAALPDIARYPDGGGFALKRALAARLDVDAGQITLGNGSSDVIENSTEGVINHTLDMFVSSPLRICGEVELRIHHHLLGKGRSLKGIRRVLSHQQSLAQCREWLDANLPEVERVAVASNAEAARLAAKDARAVAIAGSSAAEIYGLKVLVSNIEDEPDNTTRFLIIGRLDPSPSGDDKTSLLISGPNRSGSLMGLLEPLARHRINMTRIESRPSRRGLWEYVFFVDIDGHMQDARVRKALAELEEGASFVKWLGSYPKAVL